jgi:hypothetical protein
LEAIQIHVHMSANSLTTKETELSCQARINQIGVDGEETTAGSAGNRGVGGVVEGEVVGQGQLGDGAVILRIASWQY